MINERKHKCLFQNDLSYKKRGRSSAVSKDASKGSWSSSSVAYQKSFDKNLRWAFNFFSVRANLTVLKDAPTHSFTLSSLTDTASNFFSTAAQDLSREPLRHCNKKNNLKIVSAKTRNSNTLFQAIVFEQGTWQCVVTSYLQWHLFPFPWFVHNQDQGLKWEQVLSSFICRCLVCSLIISIFKSALAAFFPFSMAWYAHKAY